MNLLTYLKKRRVPRCIMVIIAVIALTPCFASAYSVKYDYFVRAINYADTNSAISTPSPVTLEGVSSISGSITQTGDGNYATIQYYADLATGAIGAYAYAESNRLFAAGEIDCIGFSDTLTFLVPAGTYTNDVTISLRGAITGTLSATLDAQALANYWVTFRGGDALTLGGPQGIGLTEIGTMEINNPFALTRTLVSAGTLAEDKYFSYDLTASFNDILASPQTQYYDYHYANAEVDFLNTLQFTDVVVPDGVTWTSESGVFLSGATTIPEPASTVLLGLGLIGLAGMRKRLVGMTSN